MSSKISKTKLRIGLIYQKTSSAKREINLGINQFKFTYIRSNWRRFTVRWLNIRECSISETNNTNNWIKSTNSWCNSITEYWISTISNLKLSKTGAETPWNKEKIITKIILIVLYLMLSINSNPKHPNYL